MANTYELATSLHNFAGDFFQNVFAYSLSEGGTHTPFEYADLLLQAWATNVTTDYLDLFGDDVILDFVSARKVTGGGGPSSTIIISQPGSGPQMSISAGIAADIAWQNGGGTNRPGHTYIAAPYDGALSGGQWVTPGYTAKVSTFIATILTQLALGGAAGVADFGTYSRKLTQFNKNTSGLLKPKPTMLNKRTLPIL